MCLFRRYEIPIGLISKLQQVQHAHVHACARTRGRMQLSNEHFHLEFLMDDSGSMGMPTQYA